MHDKTDGVSRASALPSQDRRLSQLVKRKIPRQRTFDNPATRSYQETYPALAQIRNVRLGRHAEYR